MSKCPLCHAAVHDDFGLIECPGCGAQLIVHMDGKVEYQGAKETAGHREEPQREEPQIEIAEFTPAEAIREIEFEMMEEPPPVPEAAEVNEPTQMRTIVRPSGAANPDGHEDLVPPGTTGAAYRMPEDDLYDQARDYTQEIMPTPDEEFPEPAKEFLGSDSGDTPEVGESYEAVEEAQQEEAQQEEEEQEPQNLFGDFDGTEDQGPAPAAYNAGPVSASPDLGDIARFGNSEISGGREGPLRYNLFIEGIDKVDIREAFREALTDRKLMWDTDQILRSVRNGCVNIPNVAPTKAYILITRLRGMSVQVRWEQYAISQA